MAKKALRIEVTEKGGERFLLTIFDDGTEERKPIVRLPRKPPRFRYRTVSLDKSKRRRF
jgi:hypothetical protein